MTDKEREQLTYSQAQYVSYGYFCGEDEKPITRLKVVRTTEDVVSAEEFHKPVKFNKP